MHHRHHSMNDIVVGMQCIPLLKVLHDELERIFGCILVAVDGVDGAMVRAISLQQIRKSP